LRALILLRSWRFSRLVSFWYSSGVGRQSSMVLSRESVFTTELIWTFFWMPPE
jgi:hypothetical protein